jgi:hypothetical protein
MVFRLRLCTGQNHSTEGASPPVPVGSPPAAQQQFETQSQPLLLIEVINFEVVVAIGEL